MALAVQGARETQGAARGAPAGKLSRSGIVHWTPRLAFGRRRRAAGLPGRPLEGKTERLGDSVSTALGPDAGPGIRHGCGLPLSGGRAPPAKGRTTGPRLVKGTRP